MSAMPQTRPPGRLVAATLVALVVALSACTNTVVKRANPVPAEHAEQEIPQDRLVNVNIAVFDPGIPEDPEELEESRIFPKVREAEARYHPVALRRTLEETGYWGAVRVVPEPVEHSELQVTGKILESDGLILKLAVKATDASGRVWLDQVYEQETTRYNYTRTEANEPFQGLYNRVANDLLAARRGLATEELREVRRLSELRFAEGLAPEAFEPYVAREGDQYRVVSLPADGDPMMQRVERIRRRDYAVIDALDQHYRLFHAELTPAYNEWRKASHAETKNLRELRKEATQRKILGAIGIIGGLVGLTQAGSSGGSLASGAAVVGGGYLFKSGVDKSRDSEIHARALEELGRSLESDVAPQVVELRGQTVTLSGSAKAQYDKWQRLLQDIYAAETGLTKESGAATSAGDL